MTSPGQQEMPGPSEAAGNLRKGIDSLYASPLYKGLDPDQITLFFENIRGKICPSGAILYTPDDTSERLYFLKRGRVTLYKLTASGRRLVKRHILPGSTFGMIGLLGHSIHRNFAEATEDSEVYMVGRENVIELLKQTPDVAIRLLEIMGNRILFLEELLEERFVSPFYDTVRVRLVRLLLLNADPVSGIMSGVTQEEIADAIGAVRQSVADTLSLLREQRLIQTGFKKISIIDRTGLKTIARSSYI